MPIYTVTCRATPTSDPEELFIDALSAGQARGHAAAIGRRVEKVSITPRGQIVGDQVVVSADHDADPREDPACGKCGYLLEGLPLQGRAIRCPECGHDTRIAILGHHAAVIRTANWDVGAPPRGPHQPGHTAAGIASLLAIIGLAHIGPALLAIALGAYALEQSNRRCGLFGVIVGIIATLLRIIAAYAPT